MYIKVKYKLELVLLFTLMWFSTSLYLAQPWISDLTNSFGVFIAWFIVIGLALIPGCGMSFLVASILLDKRPHYPENLDLPPITILIAAYNEEGSIADTLVGISEQHYPEKVEVIVIDDGSTDNTVSEINSFIEGYSGPFDIKTVSMEKNSGKSQALNKGLSISSFDTIVTLDADTRIYKHGLQHLITNLVIGPSNTAAVAGTVLVHNSRNSFFARIQEWDYFLGISVIKRSQSLFQGTLVAQGAFSAYSKKAIEEVGGWPDTVGEDIVLTWGFRENGYRVGYAENAFAFTNVPETYAGFFRQRRRWSRGLMEAFKKHPKVISEVKLNSVFIWFNMLFPYTDFVYLFVFLPGVIAAVFFQYYAVVGLMTLMLLPLAIIVNVLMFYKQKNIFAYYGLNIRKNIIGLVFYMFIYQAIMSPACLAGYISEFFSTRKSW